LAILIAGVGYLHQRDLSVGPALIPRLRQLEWPAGIEIEDLSYGPIAITQWLEERPGYYERVIFVSAAERGHEPGQLSVYRWPGTLPDAEEIQQRVGEAVMGVISLDNLLVITTHFGVLPDEVLVVEVEPEDTGWGTDFTPSIEAVLESVIEKVRNAALDGDYGDSTGRYLLA
jgi:hydrogenase maturation protease